MPGDVRLGIRIDVDGKQIKGFVSANERDWRRVRGQLGGVERDANRAGRSIVGAHRRVAAYAGGVLSLAAAWRTASGAFAAHNRQERALALVERRVDATGAAAGRTAGEIAAMAAALQRATTFGDEEILEAQGILLTFGAITGDAFDRATVAALDLATQMRVDLRSATLQLAKALEDPARGISALAEVFPACAGMNRRWRPRGSRRRCVPRMRGDEPQPKQTKAKQAKCSPHARG